MKKVAFLGMLIAAFVFGAGLTLVAGASAQTSSNNWTGLYIGGNIGAARNRDTGVISCINTTGVVNGTGCPEPFFGAANGNGGIAGGQIGYNWQFNKIVVGPEVDIQNSTLQSSTRFYGTVTCVGGSSSTAGYNAVNNITTLGTERLRVGFLASPKVLVYVTGGLAQGVVHVQSDFLGALGGQTYALNMSFRRNGYAEGIGGEWKVQPRLSVKLEGLVFNLQNVVPYAYSNPGVTTGFQTGKDFEFHGALMRLGFNWRF